jgi:hypothetical protein
MQTAIHILLQLFNDVIKFGSVLCVASFQLLTTLLGQLPAGRWGFGCEAVRR